MLLVLTESFNSSGSTLTVRPTSHSSWSSVQPATEQDRETRKGLDISIQCRILLKDRPGWYGLSQIRTEFDDFSYPILLVPFSAVIPQWTSALLTLIYHLLPRESHLLLQLKSREGQGHEAIGTLLRSLPLPFSLGKLPPYHATGRLALCLGIVSLEWVLPTTQCPPILT